MGKLKLFLILFYLISPIILFSQEEAKNTVFNKLLQKKAVEFKTETNFKKAQHFYINQKWDSTLVYSMKQLNSSNNKELTNYCHYLIVSSFRELKLFQEAKKELILVNKNFPYYQLVNKRLGETYLELEEYEKAIKDFLKKDVFPVPCF